MSCAANRESKNKPKKTTIRRSGIRSIYIYIYIHIDVYLQYETRLSVPNSSLSHLVGDRETLSKEYNNSLPSFVVVVGTSIGFVR